MASRKDYDDFATPSYRYLKRGHYPIFGSFVVHLPGLAQTLGTVGTWGNHSQNDRGMHKEHMPAALKLWGCWTALIRVGLVS